MNVALVITYSHCDSTNFEEVKAKIVLVVVRGDPTNPNTTGLLTSKDPH